MSVTDAATCRLHAYMAMSSTKVEIALHGHSKSLEFDSGTNSQ